MYTRAYRQHIVVTSLIKFASTQSVRYARTQCLVTART
jgi:hypothetical protein